MQVRN